MSITSNGDKDSFHFGCVTNAIYKRKFLLIDEFNRADMNKAFGQMFLRDLKSTIGVKSRKGHLMMDLLNLSKPLTSQRLRILSSFLLENQARMEL